MHKLKVSLSRSKKRKVKAYFIPLQKRCESYTISKTPELREGILLLSSHQVLFFIFRGDERPSRERLGHDRLVGGEEKILPMIYIASRTLVQL